MGSNKIVLVLVLFASIATEAYLSVHFSDSKKSVAPDAIQRIGARGTEVIDSDDPINQSSSHDWKTPEPKPLVTADKVETPLIKNGLNLKLWGTITGNNVRAYAIIEDTTSRKQKLCKEGDVIQNAVVKRIVRGKVVLSINEQLEMLDIETKRADVNAKDEYGVTALIDASFRGQKEVVELLILEGADINLRSKSGETAIKLAELSNHKAVVELLKKHGANAH